MPNRRNNKTDAAPLLPPLLLLPVILLVSARVSPPQIDPCHPTRLPPRSSLNPDQITVIINGFSETRFLLLQSIVSSYANSPLVSSILVLWANPSTPAHTLAHLAQNLTSLSSPSLPIHFLPQTSSSLNSRFLPRPEITTRTVLICDDDIEVDPPSINFAFKTWSLNPDRVIGLFARSHGLELLHNRLTRWRYTVHPDRYSIVLTKFMMVRTEYLYEYTCGKKMVEMRKIVDQANNCEDILMNFVVADRVNVGPLLVGARRVRDWGDGRNEGGVGLVRDVGLSRRGSGEHRKRRGECIGEFHRVLGRMPLRYSYGKVVDDVGEQGLCSKGGKLVLCDEF